MRGRDELSKVPEAVGFLRQVGVFRKQSLETRQKVRVSRQLIAHRWPPRGTGWALRLVRIRLMLGSAGRFARRRRPMCLALRSRVVRTAVPLRLYARGGWSAVTGSSSAAALGVDIGRHAANDESERGNHSW
jgi:hypothetical protein